MLMDLTTAIEYHCNHCLDLDTDRCKRCFFSSVDFGKANLGSKRTYNRAFRYLKIYQADGFMVNTQFGTRLRIPRKAICC